MPVHGSIRTCNRRATKGKALVFSCCAHFHFDVEGPETVCIVLNEAALLIPAGILRGRHEGWRGCVSCQWHFSPNVPAGRRSKHLVSMHRQWWACVENEC